MQVAFVRSDLLIVVVSIVSTSARAAERIHGREDLATTCESDCGIESFCGSDGLCHAYSCGNWFQFSRWGLMDSNTSLLTCQDYSSGLTDHLYAVVFSCGGYGPMTSIPDDEGYATPFNRKCTSEVGDRYFECYHLAPETDFTSFLSKTNSTDRQACELPPVHADGAPKEQVFIYQVWLENRTQVSQENTEVRIVATGPNYTYSFDPELAMQSMYAVVRDKSVTPTPTQSPTTSTPVDTLSPSPSSCATRSLWFSKVFTAWFAVLVSSPSVIEWLPSVVGF